MFRTWHSCSKHDMSCAEHDCHVLNMSFIMMFWTWESCSKHDSHVQNMTVMFWTWQSCFSVFSHVQEHEKHVLEHENHVQDFMFRMIWTGSEHAEHDQTWFEHKWRLLNTIWTWNFECHVQSMFSSSKHALNMLNMLNMTRHVRTWSGTWRNMGGKS